MTASDNFALVLAEQAATRPTAVAFQHWREGSGDLAAITYAELDQRARGLAAELRARCAPGERALLLFPTSIDFVVAFFACLYADVIAVPCHAPQPGERGLQRLAALARDAAPRAVMTTATHEAALAAAWDKLVGGPAPAFLAADRGAPGAGAAPSPRGRDRDIAFLQYTSGSTGAPKGVMVSHANLLHNTQSLIDICGLSPAEVFVTWLPQFHDMGLIGNTLTAVRLGARTVLMSPLTLLQDPGAWLRAIARHRGTVSGGPNFAYDLCVERCAPAQLAGLDLSCWAHAFNGAEPVRADTLARFAALLAPNGFAPRAHFPCYGLAEATLFVAGPTLAARERAPVIRALSEEALRAHRAVPARAGEAARELVGCGQPTEDQRVVIVDPDTGARVGDGVVGEILVGGPSVTLGYWGQPEASAAVFDPSVEGCATPLLRTGDLGFVVDGALFISGRRKDLLIVRGQNHHPADLERTIEACHAALQPHGGAVFAIEAEGREAVVVVHEVRRTALRDLRANEVCIAIAAAVAEHHGVALHAVALLRPGHLPRTTSGKVRRGECRRAYLEGTLAAVETWKAPVTAPPAVPPPADPAPGAPAATVTDALGLVRAAAARRLGVAAEVLDVDVPLSSYGLDSAIAAALAADLTRALATPIDATALYQHPTLRALARAIVTAAPSASPLARSPAPARRAPVAVIGMACRFPGAADLDALWALLRDGGDGVAAAPPGRAGAQPAGLVEGIDEFDARFFGVSDREARAIDPQQRWLLETTWAALEDAGLPADRLAGTATGVFVGISNSDYARLSARGHGEPSPYLATGNALSVAANRISYTLDLRGPSLAVDTACSSSLVAFHHACQSLHRGECTLAIVAGVNAILDPVLGATFVRAGMLAADGRCKTFDARADGYVRGEGCGVVVLKPLDLAIADGDAIWAVAHGSAVNQDGRTNGLTAPSGAAQVAAVRAALADASLGPADLDYVEAHGTGTALGDPIELHALRDAVGVHRGAAPPLRVGSVKTNLGHLEAAAGIAAVIKTALALHHAHIPPHLHFERLNPLIALPPGTIEIARQGAPWPRGERPRRAGISSFGFGGTNAHVILGEAPARLDEAAPARPALVLPLTARRSDDLPRLADRYARWLADHPDASADALCAAAARGRAQLRDRAAVVAVDRDDAGRRAELVTGLAAIARGAPAPSAGAVAGSASGDDPPRVVFLFTGQGAQYAGMGADLLATEPVFREAIERCDRILASRLDARVADLLAASVDPEQLRDSAYQQPVVFALEYALAQLWRAWGVQPAAVLGHSLGELTAACVAGALELDAALELVATRGRLIGALPRGGAMVAVPLSEAQLHGELGRLPEGVVIAAYNAPTRVVVSGRADGVRDVRERLAARGIHGQDLAVSHAFHSPLVAPAADALHAAAIRAGLTAPAIPWVTNLDGAPAGPALSADYWRQQLVAPVQFERGLAWLLAAGFRHFLELGPHPVLTQLGRVASGAAEAQWLDTLARGRPGWHGLARSLAALHVAGTAIDWAAVYPPARVRIPGYPFARRRYWIDEPTSSAALPEVPMQQRAPVAAPAAAPSAEVLDVLRTMMARLLQCPATEIDPRMPFVEMGADSIVLLDAVRQIEERFALKLSVAQFFSKIVHLEALAEHIAARRPAVAAPVPAAVPPPATAAAPPATSADALERIISHQLQAMTQLMERQLQAARSAIAPAPPAIAPAPPAPPRPPAPGDAATDPVPSPTAMFAFETTDRSAHLTPRQRDHLRELTQQLNRKLPGSKAATQRHRGVLADNRASAGFRFSTKDMLFPVIAERSQGAYFWDVDGNRFLDVSMGFGVNLFGHNPSFVRDALRAQLDRGLHLGPQSDLAGEVASSISALTGAERVAFCNSGTEAVMTALRLARAVTGRARVALFAGAYHGHFDGVLAQPGGEGLPAQPVTPGTSHGQVADLVVLDYGAADSLAWIERHGHELAAVLVEPVQSRRPHLQPVEFLRGLRAATERSGTALVFDEVITGFRIHPGGAQAYFGIRADLITYGKVVGGGLPIGVVAGRAAFLDAIDGGTWQYGDASHPYARTVFFAGTFCKHPLAMTAARACLDHLRAEGPALQQRLNQRTAALAAELGQFFADEQVPIELVHFGSLFRFKFTGNIDLLFYHLLHRGVYVWEGRNCFLSTAHTQADVDELVRAVKDSVFALRDGGYLPHRAVVDAPAGGDAASGPPAPAIAAAAPESIAPAVAAARASADPPGDRSLELPVTAEQAQLWALAQLDPGGWLAQQYTVALELRGPLDADALAAGARALGRRHQALRAAIAADGSHQRVSPAGELSIAWIDLAAAPYPDAAVADWFATENCRPLDLVAAPLLRLAVLRLGTDRHLLVAKVHHAMIDGWSTAVLLAELGALYAAERAGAPAALPPCMQLADYLAAREAAAASPEAVRHRGYWQEVLRDELPPLELPADRPRPARPTYRAGRAIAPVPAELTAGVRALARGHGCTLFMTLLAGFTALLHRLTGQDDLVVGIPSAGRSIDGSAGLVAHTARALPIRSRLAPAVSTAEHLQRLRDAVLGGLEHEAEAPVTWPGIPRGGRHPLSVAAFNLDRPQAVPSMTGLALRWWPSPIAFAAVELRLNATEVDRQLVLELDYQTDRFEPATAQRILSCYLALLADMVARPAAPVRALAVLDEQTRRTLLEDWNRTDAALPERALVLDLVRGQAARAPHAAAIASAAGTLTYEDLARSVHQWAHHLRARGVGPGARVAVCLDRTPDLVVLLLAVLAAGGVHVPIDPAYPAARVAYLLGDCHAALLVTSREVEDQLPAWPGSVLVIDDDRAAVAGYPADAPAVELSDRAPAYVIYTSGSTGRPKGVLVGHRGLYNLVRAQIREFAVEPTSRVLLFSSPSFDASISEVFMALGAGACLCVAPARALLPGDSLRATLTALAVTHVTLPPSAMAAMSPVGLEGVSTVIAAGEALPGRLARLWADGRRLINAYGPTENTVCATLWHFAPGPHEPPIGRPIDNVRTYILDPEGAPVPIGLVGELYLGGVGVALEYLGQPELTAARLITDPWSPHPGARMYRSGDLARYRPDGTIEFVGRIDAQDKVRGYRVEPGEIRAALATHAGITDCAVVVRQDDGGPRRLVAYLVAAGDAPPRAEELRRHLGQVLPDHMIPAEFVALPALPLTPNGKLDRAALPAPTGARPALETGFVAPRTATEHALAAIWRAALGKAEIGVRDSFFALGGDSILAIQVAARATSAGLRLTVGQLLYQHPTIEALAGAIDAAPAPERPDDRALTGPVPLAPIQRWFFAQDLPAPGFYNQSLILRLPVGIDLDALAAALAALEAHHDLLRARFQRGAEGWTQQVLAAPAAPPLRRARIADGDVHARDQLVAAAERGLDLARGPVFAGLAIESAGAVELVLSAHHLVVDAVSWRILLDDLATAYHQRVAGGQVALPPRTASYRAWVEDLIARVRGGALADELARWRALAALAAAPLPRDVDDPGRNEVGAARTVTRRLDPAATRDLLERAPAAARADTRELLLAAFADALGQWTGAPCTWVDLEGHGRDGAVDVTRTVGWFTALFPVALERARTGAIGDTLKLVKERLREIPEQGRHFAALRYLAEDPEVGRALSVLPTPEVAFNYLGQLDLAADPVFGAAIETPIEQQDPRGLRPHLIELQAWVAGRQLELCVTYSPRHHRAATIERFADHYRDAVVALVAHCLAPDASTATRSDFPRARLDQRQLDRLLSKLNRSRNGSSP